MTIPGVHAEFVLAAADVLDERVTFDGHCRSAVGLQSAHRPQPRFQSPVIALHPIVRRYLSALCNADGNNFSITFANAADPSVTTSSGLP